MLNLQMRSLLEEFGFRTIPEIRELSAAENDQPKNDNSVSITYAHSNKNWVFFITYMIIYSK